MEPSTVFYSSTNTHTHTPSAVLAVKLARSDPIGPIGSVTSHRGCLVLRFQDVERRRRAGGGADTQSFELMRHKIYNLMVSDEDNQPY